MFTRQKISIGSLKAKGEFVLNGYNGIVSDNIELMQMVGAMMGMEIIGRFNWLINFNDNTAIISTGTINIPTLPDDQILTIEYYPESKVAFCDLTMFGRTYRNVLFDTGYIAIFDMWEKRKYIDIILSKSDFDTLAGVPAEKNSLMKDSIEGDKISVVGIENSDWGRALVIDSMQINDYMMQGMLVLDKKESVFQTIITVHFIRRFRMMYIDSENKKIQLYVSPSDSTRHHRRDLQDYSRSTLQHIKNNETNDKVFW